MSLPERPRAGEVLRKLPVFAGLDEADYQELLSICASNVLNRDDTLFREGDAGADLYILLAGRVAVLMEGRGVVHVMEPGELLGELAIVCNVTRTGTAVAQEPSVLLRIAAADLAALLEERPRIGYRVMRNIAEVLARRLMHENRKWQ